MHTMTRWRAVPTTVWTAVGALAFLASCGLAVVLGAGLHVWSGPVPSAAPSVIGAAGSRGSGVVTVPSNTSAPTQPGPGRPAPAPAAGFVAGTPSTPGSAPTGVSAPVAGGPAIHEPPAVGPPSRGGRGVGRGLRPTLLRLRELLGLRGGDDDLLARLAVGRTGLALLRDIEEGGEAEAVDREHVPPAAHGKPHGAGAHHHGHAARHVRGARGHHSARHHHD